MNAVKQLSEQQVAVSVSCDVLGVPRSSFYRAQQPKRAPKPRPTPQRALRPQENQHVLDVLNSERFQDAAPRQVYATLLDEGIYLCSWRTMYRILEQNNQVRERRNQLRHPSYTKPELLATEPNELWSWDGRLFGRLVNASLDVTHHQGWVSSPWRPGKPSTSRLVSFQGT